ncbi:uncharacterized protein Z520_05219 [Fonsecaea multimorphosa CBS 102226]|uniref:Uncharacterized protein n=1 Tax=Fonsecaea multimorphosa CBS 102226 TaxID=1442371 RepID=A0A0D2KPU9_9EURO|nr:uncharacterized protein Z520_05219 [Fonsecaea multimorphosa CBS 102226]KIX98758.1 hypothetical protein Z520_05219 [Fonsecaea multimorphosa CBS 102226]OAL25040.1 hypothetical protein AYO22_04917 [Fonsecaea multimorphosa]
MERRGRLSVVAGLAGIVGIASSVLNIIFATNITNVTVVSGLRDLLYISFALSLVDLAALAYFGTLFLRKLWSKVQHSKPSSWGLLYGGVVLAAVSVIVSGVALVWVAVKRNDLPTEILNTSLATLLGIWFAVWAIFALLQLALYILLASWTKTASMTTRVSELDLDFGVRGRSMSAVTRPGTQQTNQSFGSQDLTLHSPPRTPVSRGEPSTRRSSSTKVGTGSSKTKRMRRSSRSSLESSPFPAGEAMSIDSAFDSWDTSSVHHEMRVVIHSSPPVAHGALATIPGSRPDSPAHALDGPFLPEPHSPTSSSPPHAATSDTATAYGWSSSPRQPKSSPPSSPINFSRPTSRPSSSHISKPLPQPPKIGKLESPLQEELIHPLFRASSPRPPPIAIAGTMVTASPMANTTITPRTLASLRSNSHLALENVKPTAKSADGSETEDEEQFLPDSPTLGSPSLGSPGPSIVDEADLPPILPGFVLSAGSRTSLVGYGKRKSVKKDRPNSQVSTRSRMSQVMV